MTKCNASFNVTEWAVELLIPPSMRLHQGGAFKLGRIDSRWLILLMLRNGLWTADSAKCETTSRSALYGKIGCPSPILSLSLHGEVTLSNLFSEENFLADEDRLVF
jgi:hypothetical protein